MSRMADSVVKYNKEEQQKHELMLLKYQEEKYQQREKEQKIREDQKRKKIEETNRIISIQLKEKQETVKCQKSIDQIYLKQ